MREITMNKQDKYIMNKRIEKHGDNLKSIFNLDVDSVKLCKQLFRLENKAHKLALDYCNGVFEGDIDKESEKILSKVAKLLNTNTFNMFFNSDARGYALKFFEDFSKDKPIHKDWGGYGIIAPDFREFI
tara:strand:+ start:603 stop:989 length:387 start_codon:yes stop_codon:yes gene_type:complete